MSEFSMNRRGTVHDPLDPWLEREWTGRCPLHPRTAVREVYRHGRTVFYQCRNGHRSKGRDHYPVFMVQEDVDGGDV